MKTDFGTDIGLSCDEGCTEVRPNAPAPAREKAEAERDALKADQMDWRKGVELISSALGETTLSCVDLAEVALTLRAERDELALLTVPTDEDAQIAVRLRIAEARVVELEDLLVRMQSAEAWTSGPWREASEAATAILAARSAKGGAK